MTEIKKDIKFKFTGNEDTIDAILFAKSVSDISILLNAAAKQEGIDTSSKLVLKSTNTGCFEASFYSIVNLGASLLTTDMPNIVTTVIEYLKFIFQLDKKAPQNISISDSNGDINVLKSDGNTIKITQNVYNIYTNSEAKKATTDLLKTLYKSHRDGNLVISSDNDTHITIDKSYGNNFSETVFEPEHNSITDEAIINAVLPICKPDLIKNGSWLMEYSKTNVWMTIEDKQFLEQVQNGEIAFKYGDALKCRLRIKYSKDKDGMPIIGSEKYSIQKVINLISQAETGKLL